MRFHSALSFTFAIGILALLGVSSAHGQVGPRNRVLDRIDEDRSVTLRGNVHPLASSAVSQALTTSVPMQHMILHLKSDPSQQTALEQLIAQQHDPKSPLYHQFLSPQDFGARFGVSSADLQKITSWLTSHGFVVDEIPANHRSIVFSGSSDQVAAAFRTELRTFQAGGVSHLANATDPQIPTAFADVVEGIVKLHDVRHQAAIVKAERVPGGGLQSQYSTSSGQHYLSPADYATIYNLTPLYKAGVNGNGQSIAVIARSNISLQDVQSFRQTFGLPAKDPSFVIVNSDPGVLEGDSTETTLDTEWAGAVASGASVKVVIASSTNTADGIDLSAQYAVNKNVAPVISLSYGSCEAYMGSAEMAFYNALWQQAAAQGITVLVSSGDSGAAGCNGGSQSTGSVKAVNGLCSSPYATCVGGTQFNEGTNPGQYWLPGNNPTYGSATGYIPERVWNESGSSGGSGLWAGGGGASIYFAKPSWQNVAGVPADGHRDVPDVSLTAAGHDGYLVIQSGYAMIISGTSAAAPSFAGMMALVDQGTAARQGNANTTLYPLFSNQSSGGAAVFHDVQVGNNSVPGVTGFSAVAGYDLATGLGSVDANQLVTHWGDAAAGALPNLSLSASSTSLTVAIGQSSQTTITSNASAALKSAVALTVSGAPAGVTATLGNSTIPTPGNGSVALTINVAKTAAPGTYSLVVTGKGGTKTATVSISLVVPKPSFTIAADSTAVKLLTGQSGVKVAISATAQNGFSAPVSLTVSGAPQGVTAALSQTSFALSGTSAASLSFAAASNAKAGTYPVIVTAAGAGISQTVTLSLTISVPVTCTLAAAPASVKLTAGQTASLQVGCTAVQGTFTSPVSLSVSGTAPGVQAGFAQPSIAAGTTTSLNLSSAVTASGGTYSLSITASATNFTQTIAVPLTVTVPNVFTFGASQAALSLKPGATGGLSFSTKHLGAFNSSILFSITGLPKGVTATFAPANIAAPGDGSTTGSFSATAATAPGNYPVTVTATGGGQTLNIPLTLTIASPAGFSMSVNTNAFSVTQGGQPGIVTITTGNYAAGFHSTITLSFSNLGPGMNYGFSSGSADANGVHTSIGIWASQTTPVGVYPVLLTVSGGGIVYTQTINVTVTKR